MNDIVIFEDDDLEELINFFAKVAKTRATNSGREIYRMRFAVDDGLKIKVNEGMWSPPLAKMQ